MRFLSSAGNESRAESEFGSSFDVVAAMVREPVAD